MKLQFDVNHNVEDFTLILSTRGYEYYGEIRNVNRDSVNCKQNMNAANELSFEVYKTLDGVDERLWDNITDLKLVWVKELNEYYEINVSLDDSINPVKTITGTSLCEAELSQVNLYNIEINSEADIERENYVVTKFYNEENPKASLLHRVLDKVPHYSIKHVDSSLKNLQRTFSIDGTSIYDWLVGECSEQFNCLFAFDTTDRSISVYDLYTVCKDCGHRGEYNDICPECESTNLKYFGEDTTIFISKENLTESVKFETDIGNIKNCFKLVAGDDDMTAAVRNINPNGTDYIYYISDEQKEDMPNELVTKIEEYDKLVESYTEEYEQLVEDIYNLWDDIAYYEHSMMPTIEHAEVTASSEAAKLTIVNLSPLSLTSVTESTSKATVESALKNYAKVYVKTGYVKLEINQSSYAYIEEGRGTWTGNFKVTNYSDEEDIVESEVITISINDNYEEFVRQKLMKSIAEDDDEEGSVFDILSIDELEDFKDALKLYCLVRLQSFADAIDGALSVLQQIDQASEEADLYSVFYEPYYNKLVACQEEIDARAKTIEDLESKKDEKDARRLEIQKALNFETYLGEYLYPIFCSYRREDAYSNDNYISDDLDSAELFDNARKFIKIAKEELYKSAMHQHSISSTLHNLLIMPEFEVLIDKFELGNWIRISVDEDIYRLRLISYEINFSDIQTLNVEFSDLTKQIGCVSDLKSVLESAQSMATNISYISKQAEKGNEANESYENLRQDGLDAALIRINNNVHGEITYGKHGLLARSYNDVIDDYDPEMFKITHNIACYTNNNWKSVKMAIGKINYRLDGTDYEDYGVNADTLIGGKMISGDIYSLNYSSTNKKGAHIDLNNGSFTFANGKIVYDNSTNVLNLKGVTLDWNTTTPPTVDNVDGLNDKLEDINSSIVDLDEKFADDLELINQQIDKKAETYYQKNQPHVSYENYNDDATLNSYVGDIWFDTTKNQTYIYTKTVNETSSSIYDYTWNEIDGVPAEVYDKIDGKIQIFISVPEPPYYEGDLYINRENGDIFVCQKDCLSGGYSSDEWDLASNYSDDTSLNKFINGSYSEAILDITKQIDAKADTYYQSTAPHPEYTNIQDNVSYNLYVGDLWFNTNENKSYMYVKTTRTTSICYNYTWQEADGVPDEVFDKIDGKSAIYTSKPSSYNIGDLLIPSENFTVSNITFEKNKVYKAKSTASIFSINDWMEINYTDDTKANEALDVANKAQITADSAKGVAENAETIGNNLVNGLGFQETEITGKYVISPVIAGGTLLIGDKDNTYAEITTDGILNCVGANVKGTINSSDIIGGTVTGATIISQGSSASDTATIDGGIIQVGSTTTNISIANGGIGVVNGNTTVAQLTSTGQSYSFMLSLRNNKGFTLYDADSSWAEKRVMMYNLDGGNYIMLNRKLYGVETEFSNTKIIGTLTVSSTKSRLATTENYNDRLLYCYETPSPMFGDLGEGKIDETGKCYIFLDDIFAETIDTDCTYQVFLQPYGKGECYVTERTSSYFVVEGTENLSFGWELKAIQKDFDTIRLEEPKENETDSATTVLNETYNYLDSMLYNVESEEF